MVDNKPLCKRFKNDDWQKCGRVEGKGVVKRCLLLYLHKGGEFFKVYAIIQKRAFLHLKTGFLQQIILVSNNNKISGKCQEYLQ